MKYKSSFSVSIVMPNLNGEKLLEKNLPFFLAAKANHKNNIQEIIIVDDGSWDNSVSFLKQNYPDIKLIKHKTNRGFSAAVNTGVRASRGELIVLINTDVIPAKNFLENIFEHFANPKVFAVSMHEKNYGWAKGFFADGYIGLGMGEEDKNAHISFYVSGGSGVFRRKTWMDLGGMDEKLLSPFYWEDIDLCYRAWKRGYTNIWEPKSFVVHKHESTISKFPKVFVQRIRERNQLLVIWKNIHSFSFIRKHLLGLLTRTLKHPGYSRIILMALSKLPVALKARRKEIKESKVSDESIFAKFKY